VASDDLIQVGGHALLILLIIAMEVVEPILSNKGQVFVFEDADTVRRPEETVPHQHVGKVLIALLLGQPVFEGIFKHMGSDFHH
jgi:hypothetical protein